MLSTCSRGANVLRGALVCIDQNKPKPNVIPFRYDPSMLRRTMQPQTGGAEQGDRSEAMRYTGALVETIDIEVTLDATDTRENKNAASLGLRPQLAALELLVYPQSQQGTMGVLPLTAPHLMFICGTQQGLPVRLINYAIRENNFDVNLNPACATVTLTMQVLNDTDLNSGAHDYQQFLAYQQELEAITVAARPPAN